MRITTLKSSGRCWLSTSTVHICKDMTLGGLYTSHSSVSSNLERRTSFIRKATNKYLLFEKCKFWLFVAITRCNVKTVLKYIFERQVLVRNCA